MNGEAEGAGSAFGVPDSPSPGDGWVAGPAACLGPVRGVRFSTCRLYPDILSSRYVPLGPPAEGYSLASEGHRAGREGGH